MSCLCVAVTDFPRPSSVIRYRSSRQLHKYNALLHQLQLLMLQRQVMRTVGQHAVSLLQQMDANDRFVKMWLCD